MKKGFFTKLNVARFALAGMLLFGGNVAVQTAMANVNAVAESGVEITAVTPDPSASMETPLKSLKQITLTVDAAVTKVVSKGVVAYRDDDQVATGVIYQSQSNDKEVYVVLNDNLSEYGKYRVVLPAGAITTANGTNTEVGFDYQVGSFEVSTISPENEMPVKSLSEVTVFMSAPVGGFVGGAKVLKDGEEFCNATLDWATSPLSNDVRIAFETELVEYGKYTIVVPQGAIFDKYYTEVDPMMSGARSNEAFELTYNVGLFDVATVAPSTDEPVKSLSEVTVFMTAPVGGFLDGATLKVYKDGDTEPFCNATLDWATEPYGNDVLVKFETELMEYGKYTVKFPEGVIFDKFYTDVDPIFSGARSNTAFDLTYNVGLFDVATVAPATDEPVKSLSEVTVFMTAPVGGFLDGATLKVYKDGDTEPFCNATLDWATEPYGNDVLVKFETELMEYGKYTVKFPEGVIFDKFYTDVDPIFSGARSNTAFDLTYNVGLFDVATVAPATDEPVKSLSEVTVFMTAPVGGFLDGATLKVYKDGDTEPFCNATLDWATEPYGNDVLVKFETELVEYGKYTVVVPEGVIFDKFYTDVDPAFSGARSNTAFDLTYNVGLFEVATVAPSMDEAVESLSEVTVFMTAPVGGFLDGATLKVYKDGDTEPFCNATLDWATEPYGNDVLVKFETELVEYGKYTVVVPEGVIFDKFYTDVDPAFSGARSNSAIELTYNVGLFEVADVYPALDAEITSLKEVTVFMTSRVGGFLDGAKVNVLKDGDVVAHGTLDWATEPFGNDVVITFDATLEEYGDYVIQVPAGVIFDQYYTEVDPIMSGAKSNVAFDLVYHVGTFKVASVSPATEEPVSSLSEVTIFMTAPVGGFLDGAKATVSKDGVEVATATLDWATSPLSNDVLVILDQTITEDGVYTLEIPAGVIFDNKYDELDPFMTGAKSNEAITLTFTVATATGINGVQMNGADQKIFNLNGVRMNRVMKGINIINGKKVLVK